MTTILKLVRLIIVLSSAALLSSCVSPGKHTIPKGGSMTLSQIYQSETGVQPVTKTVKNAKSDYVGYTATAKTQVNNLFHRLPNPEIPMYIYPHLVYQNGEEYPKPGITTAFFLYRQAHFAMPGDCR